MKALVTLLLRIFKDFERKHLQLIAAGLAYYFVMALFPAVALVTAVAAYLPGENGAQRMSVFISHVIPSESLRVIEPVVKSISMYRSGLLWLGMIMTLWLTSVGAKAIIQGLDIVYEVRAPRSLWMNRFIAFLLTLAVGILLLFAVVLTLAGPIVERVLATVTPVQYVWIRVWPYLQWLLAGTFTFVAIALLYRLAPNVRASKRPTVPGALIAAAAWLVLAWVLSMFFHEYTQSKLSAVYGVFATPIAILVWLNWGAMAILIGAEFNVNLPLRNSRWASNSGVVLPKIDAA